MGSTCPVRVISPVMATSLFTGVPVTSEAMALAMVTPALGPSLGMAPAGTWMCRSCVLKYSSSMPSSGPCERT